MKRRIREFALKGLASLPLGWLAERAGARPLSVFYHTVFDSPPPYFAGLYAVKSPSEFEADLDLLLGKGFVPLTLADLLRAPHPEALPARSFFLSFDDGYRELDETIAPILRRKGIPATFFLCSSCLETGAWLFEDQVGLVRHHLTTATVTTAQEVSSILRQHGHTLDSLARCRLPASALLAQLGDCLGLDWSAEWLRHHPYLDDSQIRSLLRDGFTVGAHSIDHPLFETLDETETIRQVRESLDTVTERFDLPYRVFAFPYGEFGVPRETLDRIRRENIADALFGTRGWIQDEFHPFLHQRLWAENHPGAFETHMRRELAEKAIRRTRGRDMTKR